MTLLATRTGNLFPRVMNDLMDTTSFFAPDIFDTNWDFSIKSPSANISEDEKSYTVELAAPGLHKKDFKVVFDNKILTISAENEEEFNEEQDNYRRREFSYSSFTRSFQLPVEILEDKIEAVYKDGILRLEIPKKEVRVLKPKKEIKIS
jgi:HSP20 family protein